MIWNRLLRIILKGETIVPLDKIGHISENKFGKDSKTYTNVNMVLLQCSAQKKHLGYDAFLW